MSITLIGTSDIINKMRHFYADQIDLAVPPHTQFRVRADKCVITVYDSKKILFQGPNEQQEATIWQAFLETSPAKTKASAAATSSTQSSLLHLQVIGSDESGVGDYFGPLTAAAAYIGKAQASAVKEFRLQDSKQLTDEYIRSIAPALRAAIPNKIALLPNEKYNAWQAAGKNAHQMKAILHNYVLGEVRALVTDPVDMILVDQFVNENKYYQYLNGHEPITTGLTFMTKAENLHPAVAAASILARFTYLEAMDKLSLELGVTLLKGANNKVDAQIRDLVERDGKSILNHIGKIHFANTQKAFK